MNIGVGSGSTIVYAIERILERIKTEGLKVTCVPTSFQSEQLLIDGGVIPSTLNITPSLDVTIDGADEVDADMNCIKGGGGCQTLEKLVASCSKKLVIVADSRKDSSKLGEKWKKGVPLEVLAVARVPVSKKIEALGGKPVLRMAVKKAGPVITDNGNIILDCDFGVIENPQRLEQQLCMITGVVETGLFINMAQMAYFGQDNGTVTTRVKK
eukprot:TRINITY_DN858_c0_g1_i1.p1 TRINITY_DN858_c0_g1~~TRINITY_DN858_c0_g1_i1.p1  ORF type:complete len:212 (+),score=39.48 TRINITY_DN858_c0_g1_i1:167-802(+)